MPEKSVREMSKLQRKHYSLAARTFHSTLLSCVILGLVALLISLTIYAVNAFRQTVERGFNLALQAKASAVRQSDPIRLADRVMERYQNLTPEQKAGTGSPEYRALFAAEEASEEYQALLPILYNCLETANVFDVYLAMYDEESCAMVYLVDPETEDRLFPGEWESVSEKSMRKFLNWDGKGVLYDMDNTEHYGLLCTAGVPILDEAGTIHAFLLVDISVNNILDGIKSFALQLSLGILIATALIAYILTQRMKKNLVDPINEIAKAAETYTADRKAGVTTTEHFGALNIRTGDEVENLSLVMADMERDLAEYTENLMGITAEKERISTELSMATKIQAAMMPHIFPPFPGRREIDIYASMDPAKEVGGDFYDFFLVDEDHLCLVMADVSGKGIPAALFMMVSKIILQSCAMLGRSPAEILAKTNEALCSKNQEEMFVTVWLGILELSTGKLTAANAGHEYPVLKQPGEDYQLYKDKHGFVLGGMSTARYREYALQLQPEAKLFLYTDGVPEATDSHGEMFGTQRMLEVLNRDPQAKAEDAIHNMRKAVDEFVKEAEPFDDLTMLCLEYHGPQSSAGKSMTVDAQVDKLSAVTEFVHEAMKPLSCSAKTMNQLDIVIDELFSNIARYAYAPGTGPVTVRVEVLREPDTLVLSFLDGGRPFDPLTAEEPDVTASAEERRIGGLGLFLVKKIMDEISYSYQDGQNILRTSKKL